MSKEREAFESWAYSKKWNIARVRDMALDHYVDDFVNGAWHGWQAKAQAVPEGFKLMPLKATENMVEAACDISEADESWSFYDIYEAMVVGCEP